MSYTYKGRAKPDDPIYKMGLVVTGSKQQQRDLSTLSDEELMLALSVRPENLRDPARWCAEMRAVSGALMDPPLYVEEVDTLREWSERLARQARGEEPQP